MGGVPTSRFEIDEKNAIIALQAILTTRGPVSEDKYKRFALYLSRLPPYRAILVYAHVMQAIANRMDENHPYRDPLKKLGQAITESVSPDFPEQVEANPDAFENQRQLLAENLKQMATFMGELRSNKAA
jgi:hypothetical protein